MSKKPFKMAAFLKKIFKTRKIKKNFDKSKIFYILRALFSTTSWRDGRVVECTGLENRQSARAPGFESLSLRHLKIIASFRGSFLFCERDSNRNGAQHEKCLEWHFENDERRVAAGGATESLSLRHLKTTASPEGSFLLVFRFECLRNFLQAMIHFIEACCD